MNKASGGDGIPVELFQILRDEFVKMLHSIYQQIWKTQQWPKDWKMSVSFRSNPKERQCQRMFKLLHNCTYLTCSKGMLKILQVRHQQYVNCELPDVQARFRKGRGPEIKLPTSSGSLKKQENSRKTYALLTTPKPLTVWLTTNYGKSFERWEYQIILPVS